MSRWGSDRHGRADLDDAAVHHHRHCASVDTALMPVKQPGLKTGSKFVHLSARVAATGDGQDHILADLDDGSDSNRRHVNSGQRDVLTKFARSDLKAVSGEPIQQSRVD